MKKNEDLIRLMATIPFLLVVIILKLFSFKDERVESILLIISVGIFITVYASISIKESLINKQQIQNKILIILNILTILSYIASIIFQIYSSAMIIFFFLPILFEYYFIKREN